MKTICKIMICMASLLLLQAFPAPAQDAAQTEQAVQSEQSAQVDSQALQGRTGRHGRSGDWIVISGTVRDSDSGRRIENVSVSLAGSSIGTVTNADGYFALKIRHEGNAPVLEFSHIGYLNTRYDTQGENLSGKVSVNIRMIPSALRLKESVVHGNVNARRLVEEAIRKIPDNYPSQEELSNAFYRETVQKGRRYISISEAVMDVYKTSYARRSASQDLIHLIKARRLLSQKTSDTLGVKVVDGPNLATYFDVVKNPDALFDIHELDNYYFDLESVVTIDDRLNYVVSFSPSVTLNYALFVGRVFIDCRSLTFTRAEFSLDLSDRDKAVASVLRKKPAGLRFIPQEINFLITYREQGGVTRLNYMCNEMKFKCDWKKRFFSASYTARCEMVVVERMESPDRLTLKDSYRRGQIFYDIVEEYWDEDYWKDYNIIEPTESLENAVRRLRK